MRVTRVIDATTDEIERAKQTAVALIGEANTKNALDLFYTNNLEEVEAGIRQLNEFSTSSWILSAILLFTLIYDNDLYLQSGLDWAEYSRQSRERLGIDQRDITEQLSAARFFIKHYNALVRAGWTPNIANRKLARAELAYDLCGNANEVIKHIVNDTFLEFKEWYQSFKTKKTLPRPTENKRSDITIKGYKIGGKVAVTFSDKIPLEDKTRLEQYMTQIFEALKNGYEPAIIPCYDKKEASVLPKLRDKYRQGK